MEATGYIARHRVPKHPWHHPCWKHPQRQEPSECVHQRGRESHRLLIVSNYYFTSIIFFSTYQHICLPLWQPQSFLSLWFRRPLQQT